MIFAKVEVEFFLVMERTDERDSKHCSTQYYTDWASACPIKQQSGQQVYVLGTLGLSWQLA